MSKWIAGQDDETDFDAVVAADLTTTTKEAKQDADGVSWGWWSVEVEKNAWEA